MAGHKKGPGRHSTYSASIVKTICERISQGESLRSICRDPDMPGYITVMGWLDVHEEFRIIYAGARAKQTEYYADECIDIADDGSNDWMERFNKDGDSVGWTLNGEAVVRSKLRIEQRRWYAERLLPKKYGNKLELGGDPANPVRFIIEGLEPKG